MSLQRGTSLADPIYGPTDRIRVLVDRAQWTRSYRVLWANRMDDIPAVGASHPDDSTFKFAEAEIERSRVAGDIADVTLFYETLPDDKVTENAVMEEVDLRKHPRYDAVTATERNEIDAALNDNRAPVGLTGDAEELYDKLRLGIATYIVGTTELTIESAFATHPGTVESVLGTISSPPGYAGSRYLIVGGGVNQVGWYWVRTLVYRYSDKNWDADIY